MPKTMDMGQSDDDETVVKPTVVKPEPESSDNEDSKPLKEKKKKEKDEPKKEENPEKEKKPQKKRYHLANKVHERLKKRHLKQTALPRSSMRRLNQSGLAQLQYRKTKKGYEFVSDHDEQLRLLHPKNGAAAEKAIEDANKANPPRKLKMTKSGYYAAQLALEVYALSLISAAKLKAVIDTGKETGIISLVGTAYAMYRAQRGSGVVAPDLLRHVASAYPMREMEDRVKENGKTQRKETSAPINKHGLEKTLQAAQKVDGYRIFSAEKIHQEAIDNKVDHFHPAARPSSRMKNHTLPVGHFNDPVKKTRYLEENGEQITPVRARDLSFEEIVAKVAKDQTDAKYRTVTFHRGKNKKTGKLNKVTARVKFADERINNDLAARAGAKLSPNAIDELNAIFYIETGNYDHSIMKLAAQICLGANKKLISKSDVMLALEYRGIKIAFDTDLFDADEAAQIKKETVKKEKIKQEKKEKVKQEKKKKPEIPADLAVAAEAASDAPASPPPAPSTAAAAAEAAAPPPPLPSAPSVETEASEDKPQKKRNAKRKQPSENEEKEESQPSSSAAVAAAAAPPPSVATTSAAADPSASAPAESQTQPEIAVAAASQSEPSSDEPAPKKSRRSKKKPAAAAAAASEATEPAVAVRASTRNMRSRK